MNASMLDTVQEVMKEVSNDTVADLKTTLLVGGLSVKEIITALVVGGLGLTGMCLNITILVITYQERLIKKDYRMLYYSFITLGDLMFSTHACQVSVNTLFRNFYVFRLSAVCMLFQIVLGVIAYQWSAMCIIFLLVDLVWSIKNPFSSIGPKRFFSQITCIVMFIIGVTMAMAPFMIWDDLPRELEFCSLANVYGVHWDVYLHQAIIMINVLIATMIAVSCVLLWNIYKTHTPETKKRDYSSQSRVQPCETDLPQDVSTISGKQNPAFVAEEDGIDKTPKTVRNNQTPRAQVERATNIRTDRCETQREVRRREFIRASRTVAVFMVAYLGTCTPYIIMLGLGIGCGNSCRTDTIESQVFRALMATGIYCLPIIDPILYTKRFVVFRQALNAFVNKVRCCHAEDADANVVVDVN